jgi:hypothetical protein
MGPQKQVVQGSTQHKRVGRLFLKGKCVLPVAERKFRNATDRLNTAALLTRICGEISPGGYRDSTWKQINSSQQVFQQNACVTV